MEVRAKQLNELRELISRCKASVTEIGAELRTEFRANENERFREQMMLNTEAIAAARAKVAQHEKELDEFLGL